VKAGRAAAPHHHQLHGPLLCQRHRPIPSPAPTPAPQRQGDGPQWAWCGGDRPPTCAAWRRARGGDGGPPAVHRPSRGSRRPSSPVEHAPTALSHGARVGRHPELLLHAAAAPQIQRGCSFRGCGDLTPKRRSTRMALHQCVVPTLQQGVMAQRLFSKVAALGLGAAAVASSRRRSSWLQVPAFTELANRSYGGTPIQSAP